MSQKNRFRRLAISQFVALTLAVSVTPGIATAEDSGFVEGDALVTADVLESQDNQEVIKQAEEAGEAVEKVALDQYWDATRMATAIPVDNIVENPDTSVLPPVVNVSDVVDREISPSAPIAKTGSSDLNLNKTSSTIGNSGAVNGKIFFTGADGKNYVCSGSAVNSENKSVVATAGHCVHEGQGGSFHKNWVFVPEYTIGIAPHGKFTAKHMVTTSNWIDNGQTYQGFSGDFGFVVVNKVNGKNLVDTVGGHGLRSGELPEFQGVLIGYPQNRFFGSAMFRCSGNITNEQRESYSFYFIRGCNFGGGASGGPWLEDFDGKLGYIRSVTSFGPKNSTSYLGAAIVSETVWNMFDKIAAYQV